MGQMRPAAFTVAIILFLCTALAVFSKPETIPSVKKQLLSSALGKIGDWQTSANIILQEETVTSLQLDDFLFRNYRKDSKTVGVYIGYYLTVGKVGAAHDPLVCLPGQGWLIIERGKGKLKTDNGSMISYATMVVERNGEQELFMYWFQAYDKAVAGTFAQKIVTLSNTLKGRGEDNAFVRLSCAMNGRSQQECLQILYEFIQDFYPVFLEYVRESGG